MRYVLSGVILSVVVVCVLSAAQPFERVPAGAVAYDHLATVAQVGLLSDFALPQGELSRLEFAVLVQQGLAEYGRTQLEGYGTQAAVEVALGELLTEFAPELGQLGTSVELPGADSAVEASELERRVTYLEEEIEDINIQENETYFDSLYSCSETCEEPTEDAIEIGVYGDFYFQLQGSRTTYDDPTAEDSEHGDLDLYWGELGFDATDGAWSGHFSTMFDAYEDDVLLFEAYGRYDAPDSDWFAQLGRVELPFGNNDFYFPTYPAVNDLAWTVTNTVGMGWDAEDWGVSAWLFNPRVDIVDEEDNFTDYALTWDVTKREANECRDGWRLTTGYSSHLGAHDIQLAGAGPLVDRNDAVSFFGRYDWCGNRYHFLADMTHSLDEFDPADLDADADGVGDQPCALNVEFVYEPRPDNLWGLSYQRTCEIADYAESRYGILYGERLSEMAMLKLEYTHGIYNEFATSGQDTDDTLVAEFNIAF